MYRCMLEASGLVVRSVPFYEWSSLNGLEQQKAYLTRLLTSVAMPASVPHTQPAVEAA